jgi:hypothetical protein
MVKKVGFVPISLDTLIAILIALTSLATAVAAWRTNSINSQASNTNRQGLIDAIKSTASQGEDWRKVYEEAGYTRDYMVEVAAIQAMETSGDSLSAATAANLRQFLLPGLVSLADPMAGSPKYIQANGTINTQKRFLELEGENKDLASLNPPAMFDQAKNLHQEQRFLTIGTVLLAASLFWLGLAEISPGRIKVISLVIGAIGFLGTLGYFAIVEVVFAMIKGGL